MINKNLASVATMTAELRHLEKQASRVSDARAAAALKHHAHGVTYEELAEAMGLSRQAVYKILSRAAGKPGIKAACKALRATP